MRRPIMLLTALLVLTLSASAQTTIQFHVKLTDAKTALLAKNPEVKMSEEQLEQAAKSRVLLLDETSGTKWAWLLLSWLEDKNVEHGLNVSGVAAIGKGADISLQPVDEHTVRVRCLREQCVVNGAKLKNGETHDAAFDSDINVSF